MTLEKKIAQPLPDDAQMDGKYRLDEQVGYLLRLANQRHAAIFQSTLPVNFTRTQFSALVRLAQIGECSQNELGRQTAMDVATIKGVVDRLRKRGFVNVLPDENDKRRFLISVSEKGVEILESIHEAGLRISEKTLEPLSVRERAEFIRLLKKISQP